MTDERKANEILRQLKKVAALSPLSINELRVILAMERAVARIATDKALARHIIFKGGFVMLKVLNAQRFTRDLDALARGIDRQMVNKLLTAALARDLSDGLWYGDFKLRELPDQGKYGGLRLDAAFQIGVPNNISKLSRLHIDIGFGDAVPPALKPQKMAQILPNKEPISWIAYPPEFILAEKLQTLIDRASANSRAKDIFDLTILFGRCQDYVALKEAIFRTFAMRQTHIPASFVDFIDSIDTDLLKSSWASIKQIDTAESFGSKWEHLRNYLNKLDREK